MIRSGKGSPHSHDTPVDVVSTTTTHYSGTTVNFNPIPALIPQMPLPCHCLVCR